VSSSNFVAERLHDRRRQPGELHRADQRHDVEIDVIAVLP
jgi:hypothetical protein